jgi:uncharacterized protein with PIN domain
MMGQDLPASFLATLRIVVEPFTVEQAYIPREVFHDFGKGRNAAELNFCDCLAYALAKLLEENNPPTRTGRRWCEGGCILVSKILR